MCKPNGQPGVCQFPNCADPKAEVATDRFALGKCVLMEVRDPVKPSLVAGPAGTITRLSDYQLAQNGIPGEPMKAHRASMFGKPRLKTALTTCGIDMHTVLH